MKEAIKTCNGGEISLENIISGEITPEVIEKIKEKGEFIPRLQNQRNFFLVFVQIIIKITWFKSKLCPPMKNYYIQ